MNYILIFTLFFFSTIYSQNFGLQNKVDSTFIFSKYESLDNEKKGDELRTLLNENNQAIIISFKNGKYISLKNNEINCYTTCNDSVINIVKLNDIEAKNCKTYIDTLISIDPKKIFDGIDEKTAGKIVQDGDSFEVVFFKDNKTLKLYSYSPEIDIENRFTSPQNAKSFLNCYLKLNKYFYDKEFERLKSLDTIYLYIKRGKNIQFTVDINKSKNKRQENYFFHFNCSNGQFTNLNRSSYIEPTNTFYKKKSFLKTNFDKIIYSEYLQKFTQCDLIQIIGSNHKKIFIIDKDEIRDGKIKIKEVQGGTYCF